MKGRSPKSKPAGSKHRVVVLPLSPSSEQSADFPTAQLQDDNRTSSAVEGLPGFLGSTSFSAVLTEGQEQIGLESEAELGIADRIPLASSRVASPHEHQRHLRRGAAILSQFHDLDRLEPLITQWEKQSSDLAIIGPFILDCLHSIKVDLLGTGLLQSPETLLEAAGTLSRNTAGPLCVGSNLRWEAIGIFFTVCGLRVSGLASGDPMLAFVGLKSENQRALMRRLLDASDACIAFCDDLSQLTDIGMWLTYENCVLTSQVLGDAHYQVWRRVGDLSTAIFALGLHQDLQPSSQHPFWLVEMRRRGLALAYAVDKALCTFVGRPPRISRRYCSIRIPLDLTFDELALEDAALEEVLSRIDVNGWYTGDGHRKSSYVRCFVMINLIREDILELSLGPPQADIKELAADITCRNRELMESFPERIQYSPEIWESDRDMVDCLFMIESYLDIIYNDFMLQRALVRRLHAKSDELVRTARLIMTAVLEIMNRCHHHESFECNLQWSVVLYGIPAAGVLALELLQHTQFRNPLSPELPRSEVIQNLSVFLACLGWMHSPGDGNYQIAQQARRMIQRILDKILSPDPLPAREQSALLNGSENHFYNDAMYDFSWLDSADFDADFWTDVSEQQFLS